MKEYKRIRVNLSTWKKKTERDYIDVMNEEAKDGWELVQVFAPAISGYGIATYFDIILVRNKR